MKPALPFLILILAALPLLAGEEYSAQSPNKRLEATIDVGETLRLSCPLELEETSWIKSGRVAWEWYNANNIYGVDFESGLNNDTYKYYIDFASKYGLEYARIPPIWDETIGLAGEIADYVMVARRKDETWHVGAMTDGERRSLELDLSFLPKGRYTAEIFQDGVNAETFVEDYKLLQKAVTRKDRLQIEMAPGGGWSAILTPN